MKKLFVAMAMIGGLVCSALLPFNAAAAPNPEPYMVKDIYPGAEYEEGEEYLNGSYASPLAQVGNYTYLSADDGIHGTELWKTDGTADGTVMVKDIYPGTYEENGEEYPNSSGPSIIYTYGETMYFSAWDENGSGLWKTDGTEEGTVLIKNISYIYCNFSGTITQGIDDTFFFGGNDGIHGIELWKSDGTEEGTIMFKDIYPGGAFTHSWPGEFINIDNMIYFHADDGTGFELWKTDGTVDGTEMVKNINQGGSALDFYKNFVVSDDTIYFAANDGNGLRLWKSDGTVDGTEMVNTKNLYDSPNSGITVGYLTNVEGTIFFVCNDENFGTELWKSDGTVDGTTMVKRVAIVDNEGEGDARAFVAVGNILYFMSASAAYSWDLWKSDGTTDGTTMVKDIDPDSYSSWIDNLIEFNSTLYFVGSDTVYGNELWKSDGTEESTVIVKDIFPGTYEQDGEEYPNSSNPQFFYASDNILYFNANDGAHGDELWAYNLSPDDSTPPTFANLPGLTTPINLTDGQTITTNPYVINVKPSDNIDVAYVEFYVDGVLICTDTTADSNGVYSCSWDTSLYHSDIQVVAVDTTGNRSVALNRTVTVNLGGLPNTGMSAWFYLLGLLPAAGIVAIRKSISTKK